MSNPWSDWLKVIQLKARFLFGIWLFGLLFLSIPDKWAVQFGIDTVRESIRPWVGVVTLGGFVFWIVQLIPEFQKYRKTRKQKQFRINALNTLSTEEWLILAYCLHKGRQTITISAMDHAACALVSKEMLVKADGINEPLWWPYTVPQSIWQHISKNRHEFMQYSGLSQEKIVEAFDKLDQRVRPIGSVC